MKKWHTISEYARLHGLSRSSVSRAVKAGRLETNGKAGRACRVRGELTPSVREVPNKKEEADKNLLQLKVQKMEADVAVQQQKLERKIREIRSDCCAKLTEIIGAAFVPLLSKLRQIRPAAETVETWNKAVDDVQKRIDDEVTKWLNE